MKYILDRRYRLRGWYKLPYGLFDTFKKTAKFYEADEYRLILKCDGVSGIDTDALDEKSRSFLQSLEKEGIIHPAGFMEYLGKDQIYRDYPARYRKEAHWSVTGECNFRCLHCFMSAPLGKHGSPSHEEILQVADQLAECGVFQVGLTGGEPLIREDFLEIVDSLTEREIGISVIYTNGWLVDERLLDELDKRGAHPNFQISFDGIGHHDLLRGVPGAEEKTLEVLRLLQEREHATAVSFCLHRKNKDILRDTVKLMASLGVDNMKCGTMMDLGEWSREDVRDLKLTPQEEQAVFEQYIPQYFEDDAPLSIMLGGSFMYTPGDEKWEIYYECRCDEREEKIMPACSVLSRSFYIGADGVVAPCMGMADCMFASNFPSLKKMKLSDILRDSPLVTYAYATVKDVRDRNEKCRQCRFIDRCTGGCRNSVLLAGNDYYGIAPEVCLFFENGWDERIRAAAQPAFEAYIKRNPPGDPSKKSSV